MRLHGMMGCDEERFFNGFTSVSPHELKEILEGMARGRRRTSIPRRADSLGSFVLCCTRCRVPGNVMVDALL